MHPFTLSLSERRALKQQIRETKDAKVLKRSQALLWLSEGIAIPEIAKRLAVTRQTIYGWISFYRRQINKSFITRLKDRPKSGVSKNAVFELNSLPGFWTPENPAYCPWILDFGPNSGGPKSGQDKLADLDALS